MQALRLIRLEWDCNCGKKLATRFQAAELFYGMKSDSGKRLLDMLRLICGESGHDEI